DGAPQVNHAPIDFQIDLVKMPDRMRFGTALAQFRCNDRSEMIHPASDCFVRYCNSALREQILVVTKAEREPEIEPDRLVNDLRKEPISGVADFRHALRLRRIQCARSCQRRDNAIGGDSAAAVWRRQGKVSPWRIPGLSTLSGGPRTALVFRSRASGGGCGAHNMKARSWRSTSIEVCCSCAPPIGPNGISRAAQSRAAVTGTTAPPRLRRSAERDLRSDLIMRGALIPCIRPGMMPTLISGSR